MVLQKRSCYSFNGHQVPTKRRATRLARRNATFQRRLEEKQMCAFDLLATVADNLLQGKQNPTTCSDSSLEKDRDGFVEEECQDANKPLKTELSDEASCDRRCQHDFVKEGCTDANKPLKAELSDEGSSDRKCFSNISSQVYNQNCCLKEFAVHEIEGHSCIASIVTSSSCSEKFVAETLVDGKGQNGTENLASKVELGSSRSPESIGFKLDGDVSKVKDVKFGKVPMDTGTGLCCSEDLLDEKPPALVSSCCNAKLSGSDDSMPHSSLSKGCDNVLVDSRDDDEKFSGCAHPSTKIKSSRPITCIDDRKINKRLASKYLKVAQESKPDKLSNSVICFSIGNVLVLDGNLKPVYSNRKNYYKSQRSEMNIPFKKRKLFKCSSDTNSNGYIRNGDTYFSLKNETNQSVSYSSSGMSKDHGTSSLGHSALRSRDSHVKLRIKSFRVPELFIEIPETATIGSLKRTVMEAVTAVLGGRLRVGVILHGKKIRDDSKTLLQTGISHDNHLDALGFALEPNFSQNLPPACATSSLRVPTADVPQPFTGYPSIPAVIHQRIQGFSNMLAEHQVTGLGNLVESDHDSAPSPINTSGEKKLSDSKELVPEMGMEALAVLRGHQKSKRTKIAQRRIRRPFSVAEVEALVQAVEKLGTGRWRDVKLRAFDNAKHRTYVDLKVYGIVQDKWKTLVHTARISPQQRRGEPVPQELLDRVLTAHAYWSQQQTKQQLKHHSKPCLLL
ncbi:telomere repeat-binding protein 5 isoform X1 [Vigna angularis]|uniref:telomere repeat-binding protein 5 isoform X1 n=1 Tax=Phaseolus angularis TaxID=3914 RepID=UPI000809D025|nr:telomere repeat-binding protein 5 isoform X1 [Vigna angularis]XP_017425420.1 telomere repeat-binding protein 5 isoform X1 [Vigna angularis]XP_052726817.1 telomere repeat-binding protein 5 isoform X1 [Vigna angularis]XP_052726818.1 telomere repeat-binding protein 5 isoform X1 [Vigna angularis]